MSVHVSPEITSKLFKILEDSGFSVGVTPPTIKQKLTIALTNSNPNLNIKFKNNQTAQVYDISEGFFNLFLYAIALHSSDNGETHIKVMDIVTENELQEFLKQNNAQYDKMTEEEGEEMDLSEVTPQRRRIQEKSFPDLKSNKEALIRWGKDKEHLKLIKESEISNFISTLLSAETNRPEPSEIEIWTDKKEVKLNISFG